MTTPVGTDITAAPCAPWCISHEWLDKDHDCLGHLTMATGSIQGARGAQVMVFSQAERPAGRCVAGADQVLISIEANDLAGRLVRDSPGLADALRVSFTAADARQLAAHLIRHADAVDGPVR